MLRARLFGMLSAEVEGRSVPAIPGFRARSLFAYLLVHPGPHPRVRLAGTFWPDVPDTRARASLRVALFTIRQTLDTVDAGGYLAADRLCAGIDADRPREVDVEAFEQLLADGDRASLAAAVALYRGPLLSDIPDEWVLGAQEEYRIRVADACEQLGDAAELAGDLPSATDWARRAIGYEPVRESCHRALIDRLARTGRPAEALAAYRRCVAMLAAELGVGPSTDIEALAALLGAPIPADAPTSGPPLDRIATRLTSGASTRTGTGVAARAAPAAAPRPVPPLLGRETEAATVQAWWRRAIDEDGPRVGVITGEGGIGKTRLASALAATVAAAGGRTATGSGVELTGAPPFAPWIEVLRDLIRQTPPPPTDADWPAVLARLIPAVTSHWGRAACPPSPAPELERARLCEATAALLSWSARDRPVLIVLDDLHLADAASISLLAYLGRRLPDQPAFVLGTRRAVPGSGRLDAALDALDRRGLLTPELTLEPLDKHTIRAIAASAAPGLPARDLDRLVAGSDGNPLLVRQAARAVAAGGEPLDGLRAIVRAPLRRLTPAARLLVDFATAAARPLEPSEVADLVGADTFAEALDADHLGELLDLATDHRIRFAHSLLRDACYEELSAPRRARLHARVAESLGRRPDRSAAEVARHHRLAGDLPAAGAYLMVAAQDARALGALRDASGLLYEAVDLVADDPAKQAEAYLSLADIEAWLGNRREWEEASSRGCALLVALDDVPSLVEAIASRGRWLRTNLCYPRESLAAYREAIALLDTHRLDAPELRALALAGAAWAQSLAGDPSAVAALTAAAEAIPEAAGDPALAVEIASARAGALTRVGQLADGVRAYTEAADAAVRADRTDLAVVLWMSAATVATCGGDFASALALSELAGTDRSAGPFFEVVAHAGRAHALARLGRHDDAADAAAREVAAAVRSGIAEYESMADYDCGAVALAGGDIARAVRHLTAALTDTGTRYFSRPLARLLLAEARLAGGDLIGAERELDAVPAEPVIAADLPDTLVARMVRVEALVAAAQLDTDLALVRLGEAEAVWRRRLGPDRGLGDTYAANLVDLGRPPVAGLVEPAVELGRVLADRACVLVAAGRSSEAVGPASEAAALADANGFDGYRTRLAGTVTTIGG